VLLFCGFGTRVQLQTIASVPISRWDTSFLTITSSLRVWWFYPPLSTTYGCLFKLERPERRAISGQQMDFLKLSRLILTCRPVAYIESLFSCRYGVKYPDLYANKENCGKEEGVKAFNCVQRGHQNSLELLPTFLSLLLIAGLEVCCSSLPPAASPTCWHVQLFAAGLRGTCALFMRLQ
jgi:hypothetical protein